MRVLLKQSVGIDIAKDKFDVCYSVIDNHHHIKIKGTKQFSNTLKGFEEFLQWCDKRYLPEVPRQFVMEATGVYHEQLAWYLFEKECTVSVQLPSKVKNYMKALGVKSKNDSVDAKGLARMGAEQALSNWQPPSIEICRLKKLTRRLQTLKEDKTAVNNRLHAENHSAVELKAIESSMDRQIKFLEKEIAAIEKLIHQLIDKDKVLKEKVEKCTSIKGVGILTVAVLIAETDGFALIENQSQLVSYAGYDIVENQSGKRSGKTKISKRGNNRIRRILHMPALQMVTHDVKPFKALYDRLMGAGKLKMQAYTAIQRKLLILIWTLWRKNEIFVDNYQQQIPQTQENKEYSGQVNGCSSFPDEAQENTKEKQEARSSLHKMNIPV